MLGLDSDDYPGMDFSELTAADFAEIDSIIATISNQHDGGRTIPESRVDDDSASVPPIFLKSLGNNSHESDADTLLDVLVDVGIADASFRSDDFDLNLNTLSAEEFAKLDEDPWPKTTQRNSGPSITIQFEELEKQSASNGDVCHIEDLQKPWKRISPLAEFRSSMALSVTDLVSPAWCEVQYDYGLRGKRHRPIGRRPTSFASSSGKIISPEVTIMKKNDVQTKQGLAVHKELEREIKFEELKVDITTDETRWALRIVNMLACLKGITGGYTREMPVFGILHNEVVIGIIDEVVKEEVFSCHNRTRKAAKRPSSPNSPQSSSKRARTGSSSRQTHIDAHFESPKKVGSPSTSPSEKSVGYILHIKDNKTRKNRYLPTEPDMYSGRLQLMIYRRLLSELLEMNPPYDFTAIWRKVGVDPSAIFPTEFLVQAHLIQDSDGFQSACLNDLVDMWHKEVKVLNILGVDPNLELVYRLRPPPRSMDEGKAITRKIRPPPVLNEEDRDLARAIAASLEETTRSPGASPAVDGTHEPPTTETAPIVGNLDPALTSEDFELQWALHESSIKDSSVSSQKESSRSEDMVDKFVDKGKRKEKECIEQASTEEGIRRFKIIGTKSFLYDEQELDRYLDHVLKWWRGERRPEGVPLERVYRCSTCEYVNDCEWRAEKALELSKKRLSTLP